ncbi:MAG: hypothetical protein QOH61_1027 [Chloroflexota bacterium]|jgi:hypothetical protein|nr:hypothetical protein [Chloroflexota bacterium]
MILPSRLPSLVAALVASLLIVACGATATPVPAATPAGPPTAPPTPRVTAEPTLPDDTSAPAETPSRDEAYQQLLVSIPFEIAPSCDPVGPREELEPGQIGEADCDLPSGSTADYVSYKLFDGSATMNDFFGIQRRGHENGGTASGPGCGKGPGEGTWDAGRKDCYLFLTNDAQVMWTHDLLFIVSSAFRDDGDFAKLEQFWQTAGPVTP